ncbi:ABC transporter permease [Acuticoccus yangtzensis]|uniref:ABC transporter permease n=1 Tax=Acuticoccus yangtzensis TaxID=1443441 RepID=UPI000AE0C4A1
MTTTEQATGTPPIAEGRAHTALVTPQSDAAALHGVKRRVSLLDRPYALAGPLILVMAIFFVGPLILTIIVSFWEYTQYSIEPAMVVTNYVDVFDRCIARLPTLCVTFATYLSTLKFCFIVWAITLILGFTLAWFIVFEVKKTSTQIALFLLCTIPFWTSNVIRMMAWIPLLGRNGLVNQTLMSMGLISEPQEWLLYSDFAVILAFIHLYTMFMMVPIVNSMMRIDREILEAARDAGASIWTIAMSVVAPLCRPGIVIGSIFVITIVMGDYITVGVMGGQQIASVGKTIQVQMQYLQFPIAAANAVVLLGAVLMIIFAMTKLVDVRREL